MWIRVCREKNRITEPVAFGVIFVFIFFLFFPLQLIAQVGPCTASSTCPSGQRCITPPEGGPQCFQLCTPGAVGDPSTDTGCPAGNVCGGADTTLGVNACISLDGATPDFAASEAPASTPAETSVGSAETKPFKSITPNLSVDIPGVEFTPALKQGDEVVIPFLAQYISGLYRYAIGIVMVVAIVMVTWGGFRYLIGSSFEDVARGKEIIRDAIAGMLLVIGAFMILQTVNPDTLQFKPLHLKNVEPVSFAEAEAETNIPEMYTETGAVPPVSMDTSDARYCDLLRPMLADRIVVIRDGSRINWTTRTIRRTGTPQFCQFADRSTTISDAASCASTLKTRSEYLQKTGNRSSTFDDPPDGIPLNRYLCRYLYDLGTAKQNGQIPRDTQIITTILGNHHRCSQGVWFYGSGDSRNTCSNLVRQRETCFQCIDDILSSGASRRQSQHWAGNAFDLRENIHIQRYTVNVLAPRYREEYGKDVFHGVYGNVDAEGLLTCGGASETIESYNYCINSRCATGSTKVRVPESIVCGHARGYARGVGPHIHVDFSRD